MAKTKKRLKESLKETELKKKAYDQLEKRCNEAFEKVRPLTQFYSVACLLVKKIIVSF